MGVSGNSDSVRGESLDAAFERFVAESAPTLLRSAYVLTGDHTTRTIFCRTHSCGRCVIGPQSERRRSAMRSA